ncbi:MAG: ATP-binding protein [Janthinobacterium lividum]
MKTTLLALCLLLLPWLARAQFPPRDDHAVDSLRHVLSQHPHDTLGTKALVALVYKLLYYDTAQAGQYGRQAVRLATAIGDRRQLARVRYNLATLASMAGRPEESVHLHLLSAQDFLALHNPLWAGHNYANAARRYYAMGRFEEAMQMNLLGLKMREQAHDAGGVADSYSNIGQLYVEQGNLPAAQHAYEAALQGWQQLGVKPYITDCLNHLAIIHRNAGRYAEARRYLAQGLAVAHTLPDSTGAAGLLLTLAVLEQHQRHWAAALPVLRRVEAAYRQRPLGQVSPHIWADFNAIMGEALVRTGQLAAGETYLRQALRQARQSQSRQEEADALAGLATLAATRHDYATAYTLQQQLAGITDTLRNEATTRSAAEMQATYNTEKKDAQNRLQAAQLRIQQQVIRRRNTQLVAGLAVAGLLAGLAYLLYTRRHLRREVAFAQERQQLDRLRSQAVLEVEENERRRVGADLHDGVGQLLSVLKINLNSLHEELKGALVNEQEQRFGAALDVVDDSVREVRSISHNLMPNALLKRGLARAVREFLDQVRRPSRLRIRLEILGLDDYDRLDAPVEGALYRITQELVQNILKHAHAHEMNIQLIRHEYELTLLVADDGRGFDPAALAPGAGIGLRNVASRVAYLGGTLELDARPGHGTTVSITVPVREARQAKAAALNGSVSVGKRYEV